jgi:hypothetical protein
MGGNTNSISECLAQIVNLTKKNIAILKAINEAFYTKRDHLAVIVDDETFVIPSFISLESRVESLEHNIENIVDAPLTGEAFTYFNGTTQRIELSGYHTAPTHVDIQPVTKFGVETNNIFKDFMSPNPFVKIDMQSIPNNIKHAVVRKVSIHELATDLRDAIAGLSADGTVDFADVEKILYAYKEGIDYTVYDTVRRLPIRKGVAQGEYEIIDIIDNYQDANFDEFYELELNTDLVYFVNNGTIQKDIKIGDTLVTYNDKVMLEVTDINYVKRTIVVKVAQGAYADLQDKTSGNPTLYKLKYYKEESDINNTKYLNVALEEDPYVIIFVAPINDTTNTQAPWGKGIFINTDSLVMDVDGEDVSFRDYYDKYVNNVGDALMAITSMMDDDEQVSRLTPTQFDLIKSIRPVINKDIIEVTQINKHLNDTKSINTIRNLYNQKSQYKMELDTIQRSIDQINKELSELSFDDTKNSRTVYETQLSEYNQKKIELIESINKIIQEISINANNSETPIENAKYRIRGFIPTVLREINPAIPEYVEVIKVDVEYRYKNKSSFTGNAKTFNDYVFSDWNKMSSIYRRRVPKYENNMYKYEWEVDDGNTNNPSYNQIDIPITQGEIVDIRVRFIYNLGYPFAEVRSDWSAIYTQEFPVEFSKNVEILDIIAENNDEIKSKHFEGILEQKGIIKHIDDEIQDQTIRYLHKAEHIASGFVTNERRVIPLDVKLHDLDDSIEYLKSEVFGVASSNLLVTLSDDNNNVLLKPDIINKFHTISFKNAISHSSVVNFGDEANPVLAAISQLTLSLYNNGVYDVKLHSLFPGSPDQQLNPNADNTVFPISNYAAADAVYMMLDRKEGDNLYTGQKYNQFLYFRRILTDVMDTPTLYRSGDINSLFVMSDAIGDNGVPVEKLLGNGINVIESFNDPTTLANLMKTAGNQSRFACLYPYVGSTESICNSVGSTFMVLAPGESVSIPINFVYWFKEGTNDAGLKTAAQMKSRTVSRMMAFDIRTSLYHDPVTYKFVVDASFNDTKGFELKKTVVEVNSNKMQVLNSSTPKTIARNSTELVNAVTSVSQPRK